MYETCASAMEDAFTARLSRSERIPIHRFGFEGQTAPNWSATGIAREFNGPECASGPYPVARFTSSRA